MSEHAHSSDSSSPSLNRHFSHIYVEREAMNDALTVSIRTRLPHATLVEIENYQDVFNRPRQSWRDQKESLKLILARKYGSFLLEGSPVTPHFGFSHFYYTTPVMNCVYDCGYCFLQGLYRSPNIVAFTNPESFFDAVRERLKTHSPLYLSISYDTDLLALENIVPLSEAWIQFARHTPGLVVEFRSKSGNFKAISHLEPTDRAILAWTLSPEVIVRRFEQKTASLTARLAAMCAAIDAGWQVRLCIDPLLPVDGWKEVYACFIEQVFHELGSRALFDVSIGAFRISSSQFGALRKHTPTPELLRFPLERSASVTSFPPELVNELESTVAADCARFISPQRIVRAGLPIA